jgi:hypothetical protein
MSPGSRSVSNSNLRGRIYQGDAKLSNSREEHNSCDLVCVGYVHQHRSRVGLYDTKLSEMFVVNDIFE